MRRVIRPVVAGAGLGREIGADLQDVGLERLRVSNYVEVATVTGLEPVIFTVTG